MKDETVSLNETVEPTSPVKEWLIEYVGEKVNPEDNQVTVDMIVGTLADEFPEFLMAVAEENFFRGYSQAMVDSEESQKAVDDSNE
tara:strand:- start:1562 stop:1819 length:258 start_codon:yes stop_codon:yes gene_type:complete